MITVYGNKCRMLRQMCSLHHAAIAFPLNKRLDINVKPYIMLEAIYVYAADAAAALKGN